FNASAGATEAGIAARPDREAGRIVDLAFVAGGNKVWHIERNERCAFGSPQRPKNIGVLVPLRQSGHEVRLSRPGGPVVHHSAIFQPLEQHGIEPCGADALPEWKADEPLVKAPELCAPPLPLQKFRVVLEPRDEI